MTRLNKIEISSAGLPQRMMQPVCLVYRLRFYSLVKVFFALSLLCLGGLTVMTALNGAPYRIFFINKSFPVNPTRTVSRHPEFQSLGYWTHSIPGLAVWQASQFNIPVCQGKERYDSLLAHSIPLQGRRRKKRSQTQLAGLALEGRANMHLHNSTSTCIIY